MKVGHLVRKGGNRYRRSLEERSVFLYKYSLYVYDQSISRFGRVDQKAAGMLSTAVIVIGVVFGLGSEWIFADFSSSIKVFFSILSWLLALGILVSAGCSVGYGIATLKVSEVQTPPLSEQVVDYILHRPLVDSRVGASITLLEANESITYQLDRKGKTTERSVVWTVVLLAFSASAFLASMVRDLLVS